MVLSHQPITKVILFCKYLVYLKLYRNGSVFKICVWISVLRRTSWGWSYAKLKFSLVEVEFDVRVEVGVEVGGSGLGLGLLVAMFTTFTGGWVGGVEKSRIELTSAKLGWSWGWAWQLNCPQVFNSSKWSRTFQNKSSNNIFWIY